MLIQVIGLVLEKATDEANWSEMFARLCHKTMASRTWMANPSLVANAAAKANDDKVIKRSRKCMKLFVSFTFFFCRPYSLTF